MRQHQVTRWTRCLSLTVLLSTMPAAFADDVDPLDRELLEALEGTPPADSLERIVPRLIEGTQAASKRLEQGQLDGKTTALQEQIVADIDALLNQAAPPNPPPRSSSSDRSHSAQQQTSSENSPSGHQQSQSGEAQNQGGPSDPDAASKESQQRTNAGQESDAEHDRRLGLSTAAWGHLPPKVREQMRSAFSEEYLPEYDSLVRRYYEALARRSSSKQY